MSDQLAKKVAQRLHARERTSAAWGVRFVDAGEGWAKAEMTVREDMLMGHGFAHGGIIFALADTAFAWACNSRNVETYAQNATISFISKAELGETLRAEAREEATAGRSGVYTVCVTGRDGRVVAVFQGLSRTGGGEIFDDGELSNG